MPLSRWFYCYNITGKIPLAAIKSQSGIHRSPRARALPKENRRVESTTLTALVLYCYNARAARSTYRHKTRIAVIQPAAAIFSPIGIFPIEARRDKRSQGDAHPEVRSELDLRYEREVLRRFYCPCAREPVLFRHHWGTWRSREGPFMAVRSVNSDSAVCSS